MVVSIRSAVKRTIVVAILLGTLVGIGDANAISARQLVEMVDFSSPVVSPDGKSVAFRTEQASIERNTYDTVWYMQNMDGLSPPRRLADGGVPLRDSAGVPVPATAVWSPDGQWLFYRALVDGRIEVWRAATDGSGAAPIGYDAGDVREFSLSPDGQVLKFSVGATREEVAQAEQAEYDHGIRIDETAPLGQNLFRSGYIEGRFATQRLGLMFNRVGLTVGIPAHWRATDLTTREQQDLAPNDIPPAPLALSDLPKGLGEVSKLAQEPLGSRIAILIRTGEKAGLRSRPSVELAMLADSKSAQLTKCEAELCTGKEITGIQWRPHSSEVVFTVTDINLGEAQSIFRWDVKSGIVRPVAADAGMFGGEQRWFPGTCGVAATTLACVTAEADRPPRLERINLESGERQVMFDPNATLARDMIKIRTRLLRWTDAKGRQFTGQLYQAKRINGEPSALFVTYYRCYGFLRGGSGDEWPLATLAEQGISTLCINAPAAQLDAAERYDMGRSAVESAIERLASEGTIDKSKVGMGGLSFGAEVTWWTLIHSALISAASVASPAISQNYYLLGSNKGEEFFSLLRWNWQLGAPDETPDQWQRISPTSNIEKVRAAVLMQMPEQEYLHALDYAIPLMRKHRAEVYAFPHEPHNKFLPRHKLAVYERNLDWFRFWLLGVEEGGPVKAQQYSRWQIMRSNMPVPVQ